MNETEARANWDLLRFRLEQDIARYQSKSIRLNDYWDHNAYALQGVLDTMNVYEHGLEYAQAKISERYSPSVPGLAEHTAAAQEKIIEASEPVSHLRRDCTCTHEPGWPCDETCPAHSAAACDTITKAPR